MLNGTSNKTVGYFVAPKKLVAEAKVFDLPLMLAPKIWAQDNHPMAYVSKGFYKSSTKEIYIQIEKETLYQVSVIFDCISLLNEIHFCTGVTLVYMYVWYCFIDNFTRTPVSM